MLKLLKNENTKIFLKGFLMGISDMVPGISGSSIAFILKIYERFINALKNINFKAFFLLDFKNICNFQDFKFLSFLLSGMFFAFIFFSKILVFLLFNDFSRQLLFSFFLGAVLAAIFHLLKNFKATFSNVLLMILGSLFCYFITKFRIITQTQGNLFYLKLIVGGNLAIGAMLLPGISGSFVLLILGIYPFAIGAIANIYNFENIKIITFLMTGILSGALVYPKMISYFLNKKYFATISFLIGLIIGSVYVLWPFSIYKKVIFSNKVLLLSDKLFFPGFFSFNFIFSLLFVIFGFILFYKMKLISEKK